MSLKRFAECERGATAIEYGVLGALVALIAIGGVRAVGGSVSDVYDNIETAVTASP